MHPFTEEFLKSYEEQIRKLPLDELYEVMDIIKKDSSPERINIVKARIRELEATEGYAQSNSFHFKKTTHSIPNKHGPNTLRIFCTTFGMETAMSMNLKSYQTQMDSVTLS